MDGTDTMSSAKKKIREEFRRAVFKRDRFSCLGCGLKFSEETAEKELDCHHITDRNIMPGGGYVKENGISLCPICHEKAEVFHQTNSELWEPGFHPDELYLKIGSNLELATKKSLEKMKLKN